MNSKSATRVFAALEAFEAAGKQLTLRELAERCKMPMSTCHVLVQTLMKLGYLYSIGRKKELYPNRRLLQLAQNIASNDPYLDRIGAELEKLRDKCGETVLLGKRQGNDVVYLLAFDGPSPLRYMGRTGDFRPLHATAMGKVFLAEMPEKELRAWLRANPVKKLTPRTLTKPDELVKDLEQGRKRGYFVASGERLTGAAAIAVPLYCHDEPLSILIAGPDNRIESRYRQLALMLGKVKGGLEAANGIATKTKKESSP
jgi:IclR family acetate operon transcriptional repressor